MNIWSNILLVSALFLLTVAFSLVGCGKLYTAVGINPETVEELVKDDAVKAAIAVAETRRIFWESISAGVAILGAAVSGYLGLKLRDSNKMNTALIKGVERATDNKVKGSIATVAAEMHIGGKLHDKVKAITG